jgi:hypothetical protein
MSSLQECGEDFEQFWDPVGDSWMYAPLTNTHITMQHSRNDYVRYADALQAPTMETSRVNHAKNPIKPSPARFPRLTRVSFERNAHTASACLLEKRGLE